MKKIVLILFLFLNCSYTYSQSDVGILLKLDTTYTLSSSYTDNSFISTSMIAANNQNEQFIFSCVRPAIFNISKISSTGNLSVFKNIKLPVLAPIEKYAINGFTCSSSGEITCMISRIENSMSSNFKIFLIKFNSLGTVLWEKTIDVPAVSSPYYNHGLNQTNTGEYYISISDYSFMGIIKLDSNGNLLWSKSIIGPAMGGGSGKSPGFCSAVTSDGGCISTVKDNNFEMIINLNADGTLNWSKSFNTLDYRWTKSIQTDSLGNIYIVGSIRDYLASSNITFCHKFDQEGNIIYSKKINPTENTYYKHIKPLSTGEAIILTEYPNFEITKINTLGNLVWTKGAVGIKAGYNDINGRDATSFFSNSYNSKVIFKGNYTDSMLALFKVDENLSDLCNAVNYTPKTALEDLMFMGAEVDTSCYISPLNINFLTPSISYSTKNYFFKNDYCLLASDEEITNQPLTQFNLYPNPASDVLYFDLSLTDQNTQNLTIKLFDVYGKLLVSKSFDKSPFYLSEFNCGLYILIMEDAGKAILKEKIIINR